MQTHYGVLILAAEEAWKHKEEYFKSIEMNCELEANTTATAERVLLWVLPDGQVIRPNGDTKVDHVFLKNDGRNLMIDRVDDDLFGLYLCIVDVDNNIKVVKQGLNIDGPYYGLEHDERIKHNAMIGGICAGGALFLIVSIWIVYTYCCKNKKNKEQSGIEDVENGGGNGQGDKGEGINTAEASVDNAIVNVTHETDTLEKIYDQADGILAIMKHRTENSSEIKTNKVPISLMDSGEYHTITDFGFEMTESLTRGQSLSSSTSQSESMQAVASVINGMKNDLDNQTNHGINGADTDTGKHGVLVDSVAKSDIGPSGQKSDGMAKHNDNEAEVIYATPNKPKRTGNIENVVIVEGDVVIEENGAKIVVTSSPPTLVLVSGTEDAVNRVTDNVIVTSDRAAIPTEKLDIQNETDMARLRERSSTDLVSGAGRVAKDTVLYGDVIVSTGDIDIRL